ncbi:hypothetical protein MNBD_UNCLBAC01-854 [hydrothermal vent metagenome]|uniref:Biopolymer transport protein ExbD/TolR n=1 Tax=hydrothermal vent metagenome TaxID=652676 RepID=A0A3B1DM78_9ZZZZ
MSKHIITAYQRQQPVIQMAPLIDIVFLTLVFFMTMSVFQQQESELSISVPKSSEATETVRSPGEIIVNVHKDGKIVVNQKTFSLDKLEQMLKKVSQLFPNQPVIIRADELAYHKFIVNVLDSCANANIWNISFSTMKQKNK